jgi:hypothetical protein
MQLGSLLQLHLAPVDNLTANHHDRASEDNPTASMHLS